MRLTLKAISALACFSLASAAFADQVDNPSYTLWSKYKPGTFVTMQQTMEMPSMPQMAAMLPQLKITTKLTEVKPDSLTLEITTTSTANGKSQDTKSTQNIPAKIDSAATTPASMPAAGEMKDMKQGKDTIEINGNKIETTTTEFTATTTTTAPAAAGMGPIESHVKTWSSTEIPGGMVKTETNSTTQMGAVKTSMTVVDYSVAK